METTNLNKTIREIFESNYVVPLYQRNFTWGEEQIARLLRDVYRAYEEDKKSNYYIGTLVVRKRSDEVFEVIDGQQRLTVLCLIMRIIDEVKEQRLTYDSRPEVEEFLNATHVDCLAIACGTAHGKYPDGFVPKLNFDLIRTVRAMTNVPLALHGTSGAGDENIRKAVEAGINKVNVATDIFCACRDYTKKRLEEEPDIEYLQLCVEVEQQCKEICRHFIRLTGSSGKAANFAPKYDFTHSIDRSLLDAGE